MTMSLVVSRRLAKRQALAFHFSMHAVLTDSPTGPIWHRRQLGTLLDIKYHGFYGQWL